MSHAAAAAIDQLTADEVAVGVKDEALPVAG